MTTLEKFNRAVITALYPECKTYEEAIKKEIYELYCPRCGDGRIETQAPITIGRVMQALPDSIKKYKYDNLRLSKDGAISYEEDCETFHTTRVICKWKILKENGQEADSTCQSEETLLKILELLK